jgi:cobalt-zinc-cadmium efflux system membrane fusion protein
VTVRVDAAGGVFQGVIKTLSPVADPNTKGYPVRVEVNNPDRKLKPGMFAEIQLTMKQKENTVVIRKEALVTRGSDKILYVVKGNAVEERIVETGIEAEDRIEIVKGLAAGEKFVIEGQHSLYDKAEITVKSGN